MSDWTVRGPNQTGPWKGGYYISRPEAASACAFAQNKKDADRIVRSINAVPALVKALENVRGIIAEGAMTGFNYKDGDWAKRLFASQQITSAALAAYKKDS